MAPTGTDHATRMKPIQSKTFDIVSSETGERVRVIIEQIEVPNPFINTSPVTLFDIYVEEIESEQDRTETLDVLSIGHPYEGR